MPSLARNDTTSLSSAAKPIKTVGAAAPHCNPPSPPVSARTRSDPSGDPRTFLNDVFTLIGDRVEEERAGDVEVVKLATPLEIRKEVDLTISDGPRPYDDLVEACGKVLDYSVRTNHKNFHNQLYAATTPAGLAGEMITAAANASMYTYEVAPAFTVIEAEVLKKMRALLGWSDGDGIFNPGGSMSNMYAMNLARYAKCEEVGYNVKEDGLHGAPRLVAFASAHAHYSVVKAASTLGIGSKNVIKIPVDEHGRMLNAALTAAVEDAKAAGKVPFFIHATAGTTVLGAYDDIEHAVDVGEEHGLWVHVDGCWGGSCVLSRTHRALVRGVERADSYAWNPHKMMGIPQQCAAFLVRHNGVMLDAHSSNAKYLFQRDKLNASLDTGDKSLQCGRRVDALKLWMTWAAIGDSGYEAHIDNIWACAAHLRSEVVRRDGFELVCEPMCTNVSFWYVPPSIRGKADKFSAEWREVVHEAAAKIKAEMQRRGSLMVGYQSIPLHDDPTPANFFRMVVCGFGSTRNDMDFLLDEIDGIAHDLGL